jgi:hypothetical protein
LRRMATLRGVICRLFHNRNLTHNTLGVSPQRATTLF